MRVSKEEKARSRARIVAAAARRLRVRGLEGTSVADVMQDAGLTHGGFYRHFPSKEALLEAALEAAFDEVLSRFGGAAAFRDTYLGDAHVGHPDVGCPVAALGGEVARAPDELRAAVGAGVARMRDLLASGMGGPTGTREARALRELAMLVGAVVLARACDPATGDAVLEACRDA